MNSIIKYREKKKKSGKKKFLKGMATRFIVCGLVFFFFRLSNYSTLILNTKKFSLLFNVGVSISHRTHALTHSLTKCKRISFFFFYFLLGIPQLGNHMRLSIFY